MNQSGIVELEVVPGWSSQEIIDFVKFGLFNSDFYASNNPDVVTVGIDPLIHFLEFGWREARVPAPHISQLEMNFIVSLVDVIRNPLQILKTNHENMISITGDNE